MKGKTCAGCGRTDYYVQNADRCEATNDEGYPCDLPKKHPGDHMRAVHTVTSWRSRNLADRADAIIESILGMSTEPCGTCGGTKRCGHDATGRHGEPATEPCPGTCPDCREGEGS